jgi:TolA-binding protein
VQGLLQLDRWDDVLKAADEFKASFANDPQTPEVVYARARGLQGLARFDEARVAYEEVIKARRGTELAAKAQFMRGECYFHQKIYHEALKEYLRVDYIYDAPTWQALALLEAGKVYEQLTQWAEAAETYERLRSKFPSDPNADKAQTRLDAVRRRIAAAPEAGDRVIKGP